MFHPAIVAFVKQVFDRRTYDENNSLATHTTDLRLDLLSVCRDGNCYRGVDIFQLYNDGDRWWILSLVWDKESKDNPIAPELLKQK